jgi:hypothetical protein
MINPNRIKKIKSETRNYPNVKAYIVEMVGIDNTSYDANVEKNEMDLALYLKNRIFGKLTESEQKKLLTLIEEYGSARYEEGDFNASYEG